MSGSRAALIKAKSLYTFSNELNMPEGALVIAKNVNIDEPSVITPRRGLNDFGSALATEDKRIKQLIQYKNKLIRHFDETLEWENSSNDFTSFIGTYKELEDGLRIKYQESNGNLYFTTTEGIKKLSATSSSNFQNLSITNAGGIKAVDLFAKTLPTSGGFLPPQSKVGYKILYGITDANNNLIFGAPSSRYVLTNTSSDINVPEKSTIVVSDYTAIVDGDYVIFNTIDIGYFVYMDKTGSASEPQDSSLLGKIGIKVDASGSSNNEIAASIATAISKAISDTVVEVELSGNETTITNVQAGDIEDVSTNNATAFTVSAVIDGSITLGTTANSEITFTLPSGLTNNHFYQIYRTAAITVLPDITTLNDLDPGEEYNLVYEAGITTTDLSNGSITIDDITTESFRESGLPLYINPITGDGILQSNTIPPLAQDITLFRNSMFYANTKLNHRKEVSILSVDDITSGTTEFIISNANGLNTYTFVGTPESTVLTADTFANTTNGGYIEVNSSNDERLYYIYLDKGGASSPAIANKIGVRVDISLAVSEQDIKDAIENALIDIDDFIYSDEGGNDFKITNNNNGPSTNTTISGLGGSWAVGIIVEGTGENSASNEVLVSGLLSVSQAIDETARSLVRVINKDSNSPVIATYLSGEGDLPGQILLENKDLEDNPFYIATNDINFQTEVNPELPLLETITNITAGSQTIIEAAGHTINIGDNVYVYSPNTFPTLNAKYNVVSTTINTYTIEVETSTADPADSFYFLSTVESDNVESPNRLYYSKVSQPEAVPIVNFIDVGPRDQPIERIVALRDSLMVFKTDGIYILSGDSALTGFSTRLLDGSSNLVAPDSPAVLNNQIFCLTTEGISTVTESGVGVISRPIENRIFDVVNARVDFKYKTFGVSYNSDKAYILWLPESKADTTATQCFRYNTYERSFTRWDVEATCGLVKQLDDKLYIGAGDRPYVLQERKNGDRTDYADRSIFKSILDDAVNGAVVRLSNVTDVEVGDVILQEQYITVYQVNHLLKMLDLDSGMESDYESTLSVSDGDNLANALTNINAKIILDDDSGTVTSHTFNNMDWAGMQSSFNDMISELNNVACDTNFNNYDIREDIIPYEALVISVDTVKNLVTFNYAIPLVQGDVESFKHISTDTQWSPQHFGDPSGLKQIREGTIMFDQNNFYSANISYSSDLSPSFVGEDFRGKGVGYWGFGQWGDATFYWGGEGNDAPYRTIIPRAKQRCRYLNVRFQHANARENWRIVGISAVVRSLSSRAYR